ncbi:helix-turn-helix domain-containing protein [Rhodococcus sp. GB-02]
MSEKPEDVFEMDLGRFRTISVPEAAEIFGVKPTWFADQLRAGKFPGHKFGQRWRLTQDDLQAILDLTHRPITKPSLFFDQGPPARVHMRPGSRRKTHHYRSRLDHRGGPAREG